MSPLKKGPVEEKVWEEWNTQKDLTRKKGHRNGLWLDDIEVDGG